MKVYVDYVFFINFIFDYIILITSSIILKINVSKKRLILSSLFGGLSGFIYFLNLNNYELILLKLISGLILVIICFKFKDIRYTFRNFIYLILISIIFGGILFLLTIHFGVNGMMIFSSNKKINTFILIVLFIIISKLYIKFCKNKQKNIKTNYKVDLYIDNKKYILNGFIDTGNTLCDPYFNKPVCILNKKIKINSNKIIFIPYNTLSSNSIMKCFTADKINIHEIGTFKKVIIGISNDKILIPGVDIILNEKYMEDI